VAWPSKEALGHFIWNEVAALQLGHVELVDGRLRHADHLAIWITVSPKPAID